MRTAELLTLDPSLGEHIKAAARERAARDVVVCVERVPCGTWTPGPGLGGEDSIGLLVTSGHLLRRLRLAHREAAELLGPGDLIRPWQDDGAHTVYPFQHAWRLLDDVTLAVLDRGAARRMGPYPELHAALVSRALERSRRLAGHLVLSQLASVRHRVLLLFWHLADQWGRVRTDGVVVPLGLTHEQIGLLIGARRPSVSSALGALADDGMIVPAEPAGYLLVGEPPADLQLLRGAPAG